MCSYFRSSSAAVSAALLLLATTLPIASASAQTVPAGLTIPATIQGDPTNDASPVTYKIAADVRDASGAIIIPAGSTGMGKIIQSANSVGFGGPGKTEVSLEQITTPDGKSMSIKSKATHYGKDVRIASIVLIFFPWSYFSKGGSGKVGTGTVVTFQTEA